MERRRPTTSRARVGSTPQGRATTVTRGRANRNVGSSPNTRAAK